MTNIMLRTLVLFLCCLKINASTHWMVTEDGRIQQQLESPFAMKNPEDLVSFMRQERNLEYLKDKKKLLLLEQAEIERNEDKNEDLEDHHYKHDLDCRAAGKLLPEFDLSTSSILPLEHKDIKVMDHINIVPVAANNVKEPNCTMSFDLPYSIHAYDHLEGVQAREFFPPFAMSGLTKTMSFLENPADAATAIHHALEKNATSWVLYNLATFYWRMKGDLKEAVECIRRALHFSPEACKDVALVNLGNILHRAHYTVNATVIMLHALEISTEFNVNYFTLANMYASLEEYNESIYYYEAALEHQQDFKEAKKRLGAVKCQLKLQEKLERQHSNLQKTLKDLNNYKVKHELYLDEQKRIHNLPLPTKTQVDQHLYYEHQRIKEGTLNYKCQINTNKSGSVLACNLSSSVSSHPSSRTTSFINVDEKEPILMTASPVSLMANSDSLFQIDKNYDVIEEDSKTKPIAIESNRREIYDWTDPTWPPIESCGQYTNFFQDWDDFPSAYVDPETRGFAVRELLTSYLGIKEGDMHPNPWNSPVCEHLEVLESTPYDHIVELESNLPRFKQDTHMQNFFLMHVNGGRVWPDDLGQRILSSLQKALREKDRDRLWVLYNLAGLYWRVNGDNSGAIECLRRCIHYAPAQHTDIPLISLSNIMYRLGKVNDSVHLLIYALRINNTEPAAYLSMGNSLQAQDNITGAVQFYNYAMLLQPQYKDVYHSLVVVKCRNLTSHKQQDTIELIANWNAAARETDAKSAIEAAMLKVKDETDSSLSRENNETSEENENTQSNLKPRSDQTDASDLLREIDVVINDLKNVTSSQFDDNVSSARDLMKKLSDMRSSLGKLVDEATSTLESKDENIPTSCEEVIANVDFHFVSNSSIVTDFNIDALEEISDDAQPFCILEGDLGLYDVINVDRITDGPLEVQFTKTLNEIVGKNLKESLASALLSSPTSWKISYLASFFWRINGRADEAVDCLFHSLSNAPSNRRDVIMYLISDYLALIGLYDNAIKVAMSITYTAHASYLLGNIHAAKRDYVTAANYFKSTLKIDPGFADSQLKFKAASCHFLLEL